MEYTILGRTGLKTSVMGLGCGGHSRLGLSTGKTEDDAIALVREALALGANFIDTAEGYGTETAVGKAIQNTPREAVILSTKAGVRRNGERTDAQTLRDRVEGCLERLQTDYVDIFHLHGVRPDDYTFAAAEMRPVLEDLRREGKIRFVGITEVFGADPQHHMLMQAVQDDGWDVMMVGFNLLNQSARERVLAPAIEKNIGILDMFAVRRTLSQPDALRTLMQELVVQGKIAPTDFDANDPLGFLTENGVASSVPDAAYRFCRYEPGVHVVLSGTGNIAHLRANAESLLRPPLPTEALQRLQTLFADVDSVSGN